MAEFCLDCYNKRHGTHLTEKDVKLDLDLCEDCGEIKPTIVIFRRRGLRRLTGVFSALSGVLEDLAWQYRDWRYARAERKKRGR